MRDCTDLVVKAQAGDREALGRLLAAVQDDVYHLLLSRLRDAADAEDAAQETLVQAITSLPDLREPRAFAGWLFRIALDKARRVKRSSSLVTASEPVAKAEADPMEREETRQAVRRAVAGLDEELRTTVTMRYELGLAYADIARSMDCPEGTVADRLHRAHERLKRALAGAGVAITMALLENELSAAPSTRAPASLAKRVARLAGEAPVPRRWRARRAAAAVATLVLAVLIGWKLSRNSPRGSAADEGPVLAAGDPAVTGEPDAAGSPQPEGKREEHPPSPPKAAATLAGRVLDSRTGAGIRGAVVLIRGLSDPATGKTPGGVLETTTDAEGRFGFDAPPGRWSINARAAGFVPYALERQAAEWRDLVARKATDERGLFAPGTCVDVAANGERTLDLPLIAGHDLRGQVVDQRGRVVEGATVTLTQSINFEKGGIGANKDHFSEAPILTDADGRFEVHGLWPRGHLNLVVEREGAHRMVRQLEVEPSLGDVRIEIETLEKGRVWGTVRDAAGRPRPDATIYGSVAPKLEPLALPVAPNGVFDRADVVGDDAVVAWAPGCGMAALSRRGAAAGGMDLRLPAADGKAEGIVVDAAGRPLSGVRVRLAQIGVRGPSGMAWLGYFDRITGLATGAGETGGFFPKGTAQPVVQTDRDGRFVMEGLCLSLDNCARLSATRDGNESIEIDVFAPGTGVRFEMPAE